VCDGEDLLVSTMAERAKAIARSPKVSLCVLDEQWPPTYVQVYCEASIETDEQAVVELMMRIAGVMAGKPLPAALAGTNDAMALTDSSQTKRVVRRPLRARSGSALNLPQVARACGRRHRWRLGRVS
jgi:hypothetical protein